MGDCVHQALHDHTLIPIKHTEIQRHDSSHVDKILNGIHEGELSYILIPSLSAHPDEQQNRTRIQSQRNEHHM